MCNSRAWGNALHWMEDITFSRISKLDASGPCSETNERRNKNVVVMITYMLLHIIRRFLVYVQTQRCTKFEVCFGEMHESRELQLEAGFL